jgi:ABC-type sugar transport system ATPase subunit
VIRLENVLVRAGAFSLHINELALDEGEFLVVLGPTGSGKTVLLETIAGLRTPVQGRVWFGEREVTGELPEARRVGFVYQDYLLFPHLTVYRNISFGLRRKDDRKRVRQLAELLGIEGLLHRYPDGLSGGERQRVALARALAIEPLVMLLDEPLSALDRATRGELRGEILTLHQELGTTVLHVTHDLDEGMALGDRLAVLVDGELRQVGPPTHVVRRPNDIEVAALVGATNILPAEGMVPAESMGAASRQGGPGADSVGGGASVTALPRVRLVGGLELHATSFAPGWNEGSCAAVIRPEDVAVESEAEGEAVSGRCTDGCEGEGFRGRITDIRIHSSLAVVETEVQASLTLTAHLLRPEVERLGLERGARVRLKVAPDCVHVCPHEPVRP